MDDQSRLIQHLKDPQAYPHRTKSITLLETHISYVLLTGDYAYKIKKAIALDFLDFRTLESRRHFSEEEIRLNRRLAPDIYLGVVAITGTVDGPRIDGDGPAIEYAVKMREFPQSTLLADLAERSQLTNTDIDRLASEVAAFHQSIPSVLPGRSFGTPETISEVVLENFQPTRRGLSAPADFDRLEEVRTWTTRELAEKRTMIDRRRAEGFVRECHGDLHLGNMARLDGKIMIFDCIEFSERMRWIDVVSEIAFTAMDLEDKGLDRLSHRFVNRYLELTGDYAGVPLLPLYLSYRAMVRAKVSSITKGTVDRTYLDLAVRYAHGRQAGLIVMHGMSGSGKTTCSQALLEALGAIRIRTDVERKRRNLRYTEGETSELYRSVATLAGTAAGSRFVTIVDGAFLKRWQRDLLRETARALRLPFLIVHLDIAEATARQRVAERITRGGDASEADAGVLEQQLRSSDPLTEDEERLTVGCDGAHPIDVHAIADRIGAGLLADRDER